MQGSCTSSMKRREIFLKRMHGGFIDIMQFVYRKTNITLNEAVSAGPLQWAKALLDIDNFDSFVDVVVANTRL